MVLGIDIRLLKWDRNWKPLFGNRGNKHCQIEKPLTVCLSVLCREQELRGMGIALHADGALTGVFAPKVSPTIPCAAAFFEWWRVFHYPLDTKSGKFERGSHHVWVPDILLKTGHDSVSTANLSLVNAIRSLHLLFGSDNQDSTCI